MGKYIVTVLITNEPREKEITTYAKSADEAADKACTLVEGWDGVLSAEATNVEEEDD